MGHITALSVLVSSKESYIEPDFPKTLKVALHDVWRFGFADRKYMPLRYKINPLGQRAFDEVTKADKPN